MTENPKEILTLATRVVLVEKAPFWVDFIYDNGDYYGTYLIKACTNEEEVTYRDNLEDDMGNTQKRNISDYYIIVEGTYKSLLLYKKDCKRVKI